MKRSQEAGAARRILMMGFGVTGRAVCEYAIRHSLSICVTEQGQLTQEQQIWLRDHDIPFEHAGHTPEFLAVVDIVVLSPGIALHEPVVEEARQRGMTILSETDFARGLIERCSLIAVSGTNGKTSTVEVIAGILRFLGYRAWVAGNVGTPLITLVDDISESDIVVLEVSSYQLEQSRSFRPQVGVLLNLTPDHLHRHGTMQAYANAKGRLFADQEATDVAILPSTLATQFERGSGRRIFYDAAYQHLPASMDGLWPHERSNLQAALAACAALIPNLNTSDIPSDVVLEALRLPHRMEIVGLISGVRVINDSKSTNAGSAIAALRSVSSPVVLLLGGRSKGAGYDLLIDEIAASDTIREVILFGEAAGMLSSLFSQRSGKAIAVVLVTTMQDAVSRGLLAAQPGDVLLFSPACSSFDAFADYGARGEAFANTVRPLPGFERAQPRT